METEKVAAYLRVSTSYQGKEGQFGLEAQKTEIKRFAEANGLEIVAWFEDNGVSGSVMDRPGLNELFSEASQKAFQGVVVSKIDRLARDLMLQLWIEKELLKHGTELLSVSEPFHGQDPSSVLFRQIIGAFAEFERSRITERVSAGRKAKAKTGGYAGGGAPFGYRSTRGSKALHLDDQQAETVKTLFQIRKENPEYTLQQIADSLNAEGLTTAKGTPFHSMQVKRVLDREMIYKGAYRYSGIESQGQHQAILN